MTQSPTFAYHARKKPLFHGQSRIHLMIPTQIDSEILAEIVKAIEILGGDLELTATIASWGDTLHDNEVLSLLKVWNQSGSRLICHGRN